MKTFVALMLSYHGCAPAPGWERMTELRLRLIVDHIEFSEKWATNPVLGPELSAELLRTGRALKKYVVCAPAAAEPET